MAIEQFLGATYKLEKSDGFDEFMKELGVGLVTRKMAATISPSISLTCADGVYTLSTQSTFKNTTISFKLGEEFDEETIDGRKVKTTITVDGNKLIQNQVADVTTNTVREFGDDQMVATMKVNEVVCTRTYKKV